MKGLTICTLALLTGFFGGRASAQDSPFAAYHLSWDDPHTHYVHVRMEIASPGGDEVDVRIPAWRPGRYIIQNYAKDIVGFEAANEAGAALPFRKIDKGTWRIRTGGARTLVVRYKSYARQLDAGASYLDETEAYINPITLLMYVPGQERRPVSLTIDKPDDWKVATALAYDERQEAYLAESYHELVDAPLLISPDFDLHSFDVGGTRYEVVFQGSGQYDPEKVVGDVRAIVETQVEIMQEVPFERYVFLYHLVPYRFGHGVEHKNSTSIVLGPPDFDGEQFYDAFLGVTAHEFFHAWNVERIRPAAIYHPDYAAEQYTATMWIYEGITSYYTDLTLARAGLIDGQEYFKRLARTLQGYDDEPGRAVTSVAMTSWDSWTKSGEAPPNTYYSFYTAGSVLGLLLDLEVRGRTENEKSLDDVFRYLYETYARKDRGVPEDGFEKALQAVTGTSFQPFFDAYVYGTEEIDYDAFLTHAGLILEKTEDPDRSPVYLGISTRAGDAGEAVVRSVVPGTPAYEAGLDVDDVLIAVGGERVTRDDLSERLETYEPGDTVTLTFFRRNALREVHVTLTGGGNIRYEIHPVEDPTALQDAIREGWLAGGV